MKKTITVFVISALLIVSVVLWALKGRGMGNTRELLSAGVIFILVGFALFLGMSRMRSHLRKETPEDELSKRVMTKASSLAYYVSIYMWLCISYLSDRITIPRHSLIGAGIMGMALVFFFCWLYVKTRGVKSE